MQKKRYAGYIIGGIIVLLGIFTITSYNSLVKREEVVDKQWAEVQNTYQRRLDLVPNLVNVVKGVSDFEQSTLENIATARVEAISGIGNKEISANNISQQEAKQNNVAVAANRIIVLIEKYPTLKGTKAYTALQTQLEGTERRIKVARNDFNAAIADYNKSVRSFPTNVVAGIFGFHEKEGFAADAGTDKAVEINFIKN